MGRGNVCVTGPCESLYYIDNDLFHVYRRDEPFAEETETRLMGDLSFEELTGSDWFYDEWGTGEEEDDILECFIENFTRMFSSFNRPTHDKCSLSLGLAAGQDVSSLRAGFFTLHWKTTSGRWP